MNKNVEINTISLVPLYSLLEQLSLTQAKAKALATVGVEIDFAIYDSSIISDYCNAIPGLIEQTEEIKQQISDLLQELIREK